jgi:hypothetical protein
VLASAKLQDRSLRDHFIARLQALIEHSAHAARYHRAIKHYYPHPSARPKLRCRNLRIGSFRLDDSNGSVARTSLASAVQPVYGCNRTSLGVDGEASCLGTRDFQGMSVRFKSLLIFTALTAPAGMALAQAGAPAVKPAAAAAQPKPVAAQPASPQQAMPQPVPQTATPEAAPALPHRLLRRSGRWLTRTSSCCRS